ncbi:zinc finger, CCHC-type containing protein, partial [Tanacetum coccineum]
KEVVITLLPVLDFQCSRIVDSTSAPLLKGSCSELFTIVLGLKEEKWTTTSVSAVYVFKLDINHMRWEEMEDLKETILSMEFATDSSACYSPAIASSELGGYVHILPDDRKIIYSYHVKDKTVSLSSIPCVAGKNHVSAWAMLERTRLNKTDRVYVDCKQEKEGDKEDGMLLRYWCTNHQDKKKKQERSQKGDAFSPERQRDDISKKERKKERGIVIKDKKGHIGKQASMAKDDKQDDTSNNTSVRELGNVSLQCPKLTEANYTTWALMMETILKAYGIWETIVAKEGVTTNEKKENTSKAIIFQTLPQDILMQVAQYSTAKEVWDSIKVKNLGADLVQKARLQTLRSELETLRIKPNEKVSDFGGKLSSIMAKFKGLGETLEDKVLVRKLLNSVPKKFLPIVATIEQYQDLDEMSFEEAVGRLTAYEERIKSQDTLEANDQDKLLMASSNNKRYGKWRDKDFNKEGKESMKWKNNPNARRASTSQGTKDKSKLRCYDCGEYGHFAKECTRWRNNKYKQEESHLIYDTDTEPTLL